MTSLLRNGHTTRGLSLISPLVKRKIVYVNSGSYYWSSTDFSGSSKCFVTFRWAFGGDILGGMQSRGSASVYSVRPVVALRGDDVEGWVEAYQLCCRKLKSSLGCTTYRVGYERDLLLLIREVKSRVYKPLESSGFVVSYPRPREIFSPNFRDRIVQTWIFLKIESLLEERYKNQGDVLFSCRKGHGVLSAVSKLKDNIEEISEGYTKEAWVGKFDISNFFLSIPKERLLPMITDFLKTNYKGKDIDDLLWLIGEVIKWSPKESCTITKKWDVLSPERTLFNLPENIGLNIGCLVSQALANFYLSWFDEYIIRTFPEVKYIRYVDDFVVVSESKKIITELWDKSKEFLWSRLGLVLHPDKKYIQEVKKGVKFLGQVIKPGRLYLSNRTIGKFYDVLMSMEVICKEIITTSPKELELYQKLEGYLGRVNSYLGTLSHVNSYAIRTELFNDRLGWFWAVCEVNDKTSVVRIKPEYKLKTIYEKNRNKKTRSTNNRSKSKKVLDRKLRGNSRSRRDLDLGSYQT